MAPKPYAPVNAPMINLRTGLITTPWLEFFTNAQNPTASGITGLTGDGTASGPGIVPFTLSDTGVTPGTYGDSTHVSQVTVDAKGRLTSAANVAIAATGDVTHTGTLTNHAVILGNGGADVKALSSLGAIGQVLTSAGSGSDPTFQSLPASTVVALARLLGDGATSAFLLPDLAEYVFEVGSAGAIVDPSLYTLSTDGSTVTFTAAPAAGNVLTFNYVLATV